MKLCLIEINFTESNIRRQHYCTRNSYTDKHENLRFLEFVQVTFEKHKLLSTWINFTTILTEDRMNLRSEI